MPTSIAIIDPDGDLTMRTTDGRDVKASYYDVHCRNVSPGDSKAWHYWVTLKNGKKSIPVGQVFHRAASLNGWDAIPDRGNPAVHGFVSRRYAIDYMLRFVPDKVHRGWDE